MKILNASRPLVALTVVAASAAAIGAATYAAYAAPAAAPAKTATPRTLSFVMTARFASPSAGEAGQTVDSKVWSKGNRVRLETVLSDRRVVFLMAPPYIYKLIPGSKAGIRWKNDKTEMGGLDLQSMLRNPAMIRAVLKSRGAKTVGSARLNGTLVDVVTARDLMGQKGTAKAWLRKSDALPLRLELKSGGLSGAVSWRNYKRDAPLSDSLFKVPSGYKVRESQGSAGAF